MPFSPCRCRQLCTLTDAPRTPPVHVRGRNTGCASGVSTDPKRMDELRKERREGGRGGREGKGQKGPLPSPAAQEGGAPWQGLHNQGSPSAPSTSGRPSIHRAQVPVHVLRLNDRSLPCHCHRTKHLHASRVELRQTRTTNLRKDPYVTSGQRWGPAAVFSGPTHTPLMSLAMRREIRGTGLRGHHRLRHWGTTEARTGRWVGVQTQGQRREGRRRDSPGRCPEVDPNRSPSLATAPTKTSPLVRGRQ